MSIIKKPLKKDPPAKCTRWRVIIYNRVKRRHEWCTVHGTLADARTLERQLNEKLVRRTYVAKSDRMTLQAVAEAYLKECRARGRRTSTLLNYQSALNGYILPRFGPYEVGTLQKKEVRAWCAEQLAAGLGVSLVNRLIRIFKTVLYFAMTELDVVERNVLMRFKQYERTAQSPGRRVNRGAYTEAELQALLTASRPRDRALIGLLCLTGIRPAEAYALRQRDVDLQAGAAVISRNWDWRGKLFTTPKTDAGIRTVALSAWLIVQLRSYLATRPQDPDRLLFATRTGKPLNPSGVRRDIWLKVVKRAKVRQLDMYSLRHTFASLGRVAGESAFNVARAMGHSRSTLVDDVYAHSLPSGMASVAERVTARALGLTTPLRVIDGGQRAVRRSLDDDTKEPVKQAASG